MSEDLLAKFEEARSRLTFARPYFTAAAYKLKLIVTPEAASLHVDTYGRLYAAPGWLARYDVGVVATGIAHELHHILRDHAGRGKTIGVVPATRAAWNEACDCEINPGLMDDCVGQQPVLPVLPPEWCLRPEQFGMEVGSVAERYFSERVRQRAMSMDRGEERGRTADGCGSGATGVEAPWEVAQSAAEGLDDAQLWQLRRDTAQAVIEHTARGSVPGSLVDWATDLLRPKQVPWDRMLGSLMRRGVQQGGSVLHSSYSRLSRRQDVYGELLMPSYRRVSPTMAFVRDTSESMQHVTALVRGVVEQVCAHTGSALTLIDVDVEVQEVRQVSSGRIAAHGGGGTDMRVGIERAFAHPRPVDVAIVCTDCDTPWPARRPRGHVIVAAVGAADAYLDMVPSWAQVVRVEQAGEAL